MKEKIRNIVPILLLLLPIFVINVAHHIISGITMDWHKSEQVKHARQKLDEISSNTDLVTQFSYYGTRLKKSLKYVPVDKRPMIKQIVGNVLKKPFPIHDTFVFQTEKNGRTKILLSPEKVKFGKTAWKKSFYSLLALNSNIKQKDSAKRINAKILSKLFGSSFFSHLFAQDLRGIATPVIYNSNPSWLVWDYTEHENGNIIGFFIIVSRVTNNLKRSLYQLSATLSALGDKNLGGFIKIFKKGAPSLYSSASIRKNLEFVCWHKHLGFCISNSLKWEKEGFAWAKDMGQMVLYTRIIPKKSHLAFILLPKVVIEKMPLWVFMLNLILITLLVGLVLRGWLFDRWPLANLNKKFLYIYLISIVLPAGLYTTTAYAYLYETQKSERKQLEEILIKELVSFESGKDAFSKEYESSFKQAIRDKLLEKLLQENVQNEKFANKDEIFANFSSHFANGNVNLPLDYLAVYALNGEIIYKAFEESREKVVRKTVNFFSLPLIEALRGQLSAEDSDYILPDYTPCEEAAMAAQAYEHTERTIVGEFERFRGATLSLNGGGEQSIFLHDFVSIAGKQRFIMQCSWRDRNISPVIIKKAAAELGFKNPDIKFIAFKKLGIRLEPLMRPDKSIDAKILPFLKRSGRLALNKSMGISRFNTNNHSIITLTTKTFQDIVLVAAISHDSINVKYKVRFFVFIIVGVLSFIIILISAYITYLRAVAPIRKLKKALQDINSGNLDFDIKTKRKDEIGVLTHEFSSMVSGLKERERLASILSDQAISAIAANENVSSVESTGEVFNGVVLITDIRDFTTLCEHNDTPDITHMLNDHFDEMASSISNEGGKIYKFIGDAIEAVFLSDDEDTTEGLGAEERAIRASIDMLARLRVINDKRKIVGKFTYRIGIGLSAGEIIGGTIGSADSRLDYALLSDAFNKAEKLEASTKKIPKSPLIFDKSILDKIIDKHEYSISSIDVEDEELFYIENIDERLKASINNITISSAKYQGDIVDQRKANQEDNSFSFKRFFTFFFGVLCAFIPVFIWSQSQLVVLKNKQANNRLDTIASCKEMKNKLLAEKPAKVFFDEYLNTRINEITDEIPDENISTREIHLHFERFYNELLSMKAIPKLFIVEHSVKTKQPVRAKYYINMLVGITNNLQSISDYFDLQIMNTGYRKILQELGYEKLSDHFCSDIYSYEEQIQGKSQNSNKFYPICFHIEPKLEKLALEYKQLLSTLVWRFINRGFGQFVFNKFKDNHIISIGRICTSNDMIASYYSRLFSVKVLGENFSMYWKFLTKWDKASTKKMRSIVSPSEMRTIDTSKYESNLGAIMTIFPQGIENKIFSSVIAYIMKKDNYQCLIKSEETGEMIKSKDFPFKAIGSHKSKKIVANPDGWVVENVAVYLGKEGKTNVFIAKKIEMIDYSVFYKKMLIVMTLLIVLIGLWYKTIYSEQAFAIKFSWQLWLGLLVAASLPLTAVFIVNELFAQEQTVLRPLEERIELLHYFDSLERRQYFAETLSANYMIKISFDDEVHNLIKDYRTLPPQHVREQVRNHIFKIQGNYKSFDFNELTICSKYGWSMPMYTFKRKNQDTRFRSFLRTIANSLFSDLKSLNNDYYSANPKSKNSALTDDLIREDGLKVFHSMFGSANFFKMTSGLGMQVALSAETGLAYLTFVPYPTLHKPDFLFYWQKTDGLNGNCRRIAQEHNSKYGIFVFQRLQHGVMERTSASGWYRDAIDLARWSHVTQLQQNIKKTIASKTYLVEVTRGNLTEAMITMGLAAEDEIMTEIESGRLELLYWLFISIIAIIILAVVASSDITGPIRELINGTIRVRERDYSFRVSDKRRDELGQLFSEFNLMVRGLEEKEMMGKMVSRTARLATSDENSHKRAEEGMELDVVVMFITVPAFDMYLSMTKATELFVDLQQHIDHLCHVIIDNGGDIDKLIGEKVLAVFYDPKGYEHSIRASLKAAAAIMKAERNGDLRFPVALGLHNGPVIAGLLGVGKHRDFTVIGDTVNTSARIAGKAAMMPMERVLVSEDLKAIAASEAVFRQYGEVELKGKADTMSLYQTVFR